MIFFITKIKEKIKGYSLVELSIVLLIISIIAGGAITTASSSIEVAKEKQTYNKMKIIDEALVGFVAINNRLPCPARPNLPQSDNNYGLEDCSTIISTDGNNVHIGAVPVSTLLLPEGFIADGWNRKFTYAVDRRLYTSSGLIAFADDEDVSPPTLDAASDGLDIFTDNGNSIVLRSAFLVMSHGKNGHGAWLNTAAATPTIFDSGSTDASENNNANVVGNTTDNRFIVKDRDINYDDILFYRNKNQLIRKAGYVFSGQECLDAINVIYYPGANRGVESLCADASENDICNQLISTMVQTVNKLCIVKQ